MKCASSARPRQRGVLRQEWMKSLGLAYSDDEEGEGFERCMRLGGQITEQFVALCVQVTRALHDGGRLLVSSTGPSPSSCTSVNRNYPDIGIILTVTAQSKSPCY